MAKNKVRRKEDFIFEEDFRASNPGLHLLYVKWAVQTLSAIDACINKLAKISFHSVNGSIRALHNEREKLLKKSAAFADAQEILDLIKGQRKEF